jgi:hypothetical protein
MVAKIMKNVKFLLLANTLMLESLFLFNSLSADDSTKSEVTTQGLNTVISTPNGEWLIGSQKVYAAQCGVDVTLFTLKYFKVISIV